MKINTTKQGADLSGLREDMIQGEPEAVKQFARLGSPRVLVVGDLMLDEYIVGDCDRISPEAPVPLVRVHTRETMLGGAGNVAANITALGGIPDIVAAVGGSIGGVPDVTVCAKLTETGILEPGLVPLAGRATTRKTRLVAGMYQVARFDEEVNSPLSDVEAVEVARLAISRLPHTDVVVLSDYSKGVLNPTVIAEIIGSAAKRGIPVIVDPKGDGFSRYSGATLLTPNASEARIASNSPPDSNDWNQITSRLMHVAQVNAIAVTCGAEGIILRERHDTSCRQHRTVARAIADVTGAGDTVVAAFALALGSGFDLVAATDIANFAAGIVVAKRGTSTVSRKELAEVVSRNPLNKAMSVDQAVALAESLRQRGKRVVFTNGCFDILHAGHVQFLKEARKLGDVLIVGLNSDESVCRIKGFDRPVQGFEIRSCVLAGLTAVDAVVPFSEDTPAEIVRRLKPDTIVKGGDYRSEEVIGREYSRSVVIIPTIEGQSTSGIINAIRGIQARQ